MVLELELVDDFNDPVVAPDAAVNLTNSKKITPANTSNDWQIENVQVKCDLVTLDNGLQNSYDAHLLAGNAYPINYNTFITQCQNAIGGTTMATSKTYGQQKINLSVSRAVTRLKSVFITLDKEVPYEFSERGFKARKSFNYFYSPMND